MLVEGVAVEYIVEIKVFTDAADDQNPAELVGQAVEEDLALDLKRRPRPEAMASWVVAAEGVDPFKVRTCMRWVPMRCIWM